MGEELSFTTDEGEVESYLALPTSGRGPGVVVVSEWWGLVDHIKSVCDRLAAEGFAALAPDMFGGQTTKDAAVASRMKQECDPHESAVKLSGAIGYLLQREEVAGDKVGVAGYCMGGALALLAADKAAGKVAACDAYYPVIFFDHEFAAIECPVVVRVGTDDELVSVERAEEIAQLVREAGSPDVEVRIYDGAGHAFFNDARPEAHDAKAANEAWQDTLRLFRQHLSAD